MYRVEQTDILILLDLIRGNSHPMWHLHVLCYVEYIVTKPRILEELVSPNSNTCGTKCYYSACFYIFVFR